LAPNEPKNSVNSRHETGSNAAMGFGYTRKQRFPMGPTRGQKAKSVSTGVEIEENGKKKSDLEFGCAFKSHWMGK